MRNNNRNFQQNTPPDNTFHENPRWDNWQQNWEFPCPPQGFYSSFGHQNMERDPSWSPSADHRRSGNFEHPKA